MSIDYDDEASELEALGSLCDDEQYDADIEEEDCVELEADDLGL